MRGKFLRGIFGILIVFLFNFEQVLAYSTPRGGLPSHPHRYVPYRVPVHLQEFLKRNGLSVVEIPGQIDPSAMWRMKIDPKKVVVRNAFTGEFPVEADGSFVAKVVAEAPQNLFLIDKSTGKLLLIGQFRPGDSFIWIDPDSTFDSLLGLFFVKKEKIEKNREKFQRAREKFRENLERAKSLSDYIRAEFQKTVAQRKLKTMALPNVSAGPATEWPNWLEYSITEVDEEGGKMEIRNPETMWFYVKTSKDEVAIPRASFDLLKIIKVVVNKLLGGEDIEKQPFYPFREKGKAKVRIGRDSSFREIINVYNPTPFVLGPQFYIDYGKFMKRFNKLSEDEKIYVYLAGLSYAVDLVAYVFIKAVFNGKGGEEAKNLLAKTSANVIESLISSTVFKLQSTLEGNSEAKEDPVGYAFSHLDEVYDTFKDMAVDLGVDFVVTALVSMAGVKEAELILEIFNFSMAIILILVDALIHPEFGYPKWTKEITVSPNLSHLIAYWPFDGNANDQSGHNMNGEVHGATLCKDRHGNSRKAYCFNGHSYLVFPSEAINDLKEGTVSIWFKLDKLNRRHALIDKTITGDVNAIQILITENNKLHVSIGAYYGEKWGYYSNASFQKGKWYHIAVTWDGSYWKIYVNGKLDKSIKDSRTVPSENIRILMGKADYDAWDPYTPDYMMGAIDEVKVFDKALSASEIKELSKE